MNSKNLWKHRSWVTDLSTCLQYTYKPYNSSNCLNCIKFFFFFFRNFVHWGFLPQKVSFILFVHCSLSSATISLRSYFSNPSLKLPPNLFFRWSLLFLPSGCQFINKLGKNTKKITDRRKKKNPTTTKLKQI